MMSLRSAALLAAIAVVGSSAVGQEAPAPPPTPRLGDLIQQLKDPDWNTRMDAATTIGTLGPLAKPAIPNLVEALNDPVAPVRMKAIDALMLLGTWSAEASPRIVPLLEDPDERVRLSAVVALPRVTPDQESTVPLLKKALGDKAWSVRRRAAIELIHQGAEVPAALPVAREGLKDPIPSDRLDVIVTLARVAAPAERKALAAMAGEYLDVPDFQLARQAAGALAGFGADGVPSLVRVLQAGRAAPVVLVAAFRALARIGPEAREALPALQQLKQREGVMWLRGAETTIAAIEGRQPPPMESYQRRGPPPAAPTPVPRPSPQH